VAVFAGFVSDTVFIWGSAAVLLSVVGRGSGREMKMKREKERQRMARG